MFCIATFIVFGILSIFSAAYRPLAKAAWHCTWRRVTLRPCDISFNEEMRGKLLSKLVFRMPRLAKILDRWLDWISFVFVALSIWSLLYTANAGLNYWVYGTCDPRNVESCVLGGEACGVDQVKLGVVQATREGRVAEWAAGPFVRFGETLTRIPDRIRSWDAALYLPPTATFFRPRDPAKPSALEIIDPGCKFCKKLTGNLLAAGVEERANLTYLLYPIPQPDGSYKFANSLLMAQYLEAMKQVPLSARPSVSPPPDWQLLEKLFAEAPAGTMDLQTQFNIGFTRSEAQHRLRELLAEIGFNNEEIDRIALLATSEEIAARIAEQRRIAEEEIRTIKIPTLLFGGRRYDRVVDVETLREE